MPTWQIKFCPPEGEKKSPFTEILEINDPDERAIIFRRLVTIGQLEINEWPHTWVKQIGDTYQLTAGNYRLYFGIYRGRILVCYVCRKVSQQARQKDLATANELVKKHLAVEKRKDLSKGN